MENRITRQAATVAAIAIVSTATILGLYIAERLAYDRYSPVAQMKGYLDCLQACAVVEMPKVERQIGDQTIIISGPSCSEVCGRQKPQE